MKTRFRLPFSPFLLFVAITTMIASDIYHTDLVAQDRPLAVVRRFKPTVVMATNQKGVYTLDEKNTNKELMFDGDTLTTDKEGYALVIFMDNTVAKVKPESRLIVRGESLADSKISKRRINLEGGEIFMEVEPLGAGTFEVATSRSLASVKGTNFGTKSFGYVWVEEGQVDVTATNSGETVSLFEKMYAQVDEAGGNLVSGTLTDDELTNLNDGYNELDEDLVEKTIILRFRDANGQIREIPINFFEKKN